MFYDAVSRNTVKITLSEADMRRYSLKKEAITGRTDENKRSLTRFLKKFQSESSMLCEFSADRLFLEAFPSDEGGCVLYVSTLCEQEKADISGSAAKTGAVVMCGGMSLSDAAGLCKRLLPFCGGLPSRLICGEGYSIVIECSEREREKLCRFMSEYGDVTVSDEAIAAAEEHGLVVADDCAVRLLAGLA